MLIDQLANTYARAICAIAQEKGMLDEVGAQLNQIAQTISENSDLANLLYHPRVPAEAKKETINIVFAQGLEDFVQNFLLLLLDKRRETAFPKIVKEYTALANEIKNVAEADVIVAKDLTDAQKKALTDKLSKITGKNIVLKVRFDENIIGGVIVKIGDKLIDGSVTRQIKSMKSALLSEKLVAG